jgi:8-oxo-dGTP pyrophosphatase MutT (NUDIX family)
MLVESTSGRWILPKGKVELFETEWACAQREAYEEAGVLGRIQSKPVGTFLNDGGTLPLLADEIAVYPLFVEVELERYPESARARRWATLRDVIVLVDVEQASVILSFASTFSYSSSASS